MSDNVSGASKSRGTNGGVRFPTGVAGALVVVLMNTGALVGQTSAPAGKPPGSRPWTSGRTMDVRGVHGRTGELIAPTTAPSLHRRHRSDDVPQIPEGLLTSQEGTKTAFTLSGRVVDASGRPISQASVNLLVVRDEAGLVTGGSATWPYLRSHTDTQGKFSLRGSRTGQALIVAQASGYAPELKEVKLGSQTPMVEVRLGPGHLLKGRFVDGKGKGIEGLSVTANHWRGYELTLGGFRTDDEGRFAWKDAPPDPVGFDVIEKGYARQKPKWMASKEEHAAVLRRPLKITGKVTDAGTGQPVTGYTIRPCGDLPGSRRAEVAWGLGRPVRTDQDRFTLEFESYVDLQGPFQFRLEAEGYNPHISRVFQPDEEEAQCEVKLSKGVWFEGIVRTNDKRPVGKARVILGDAAAVISITDRSVDRMSRGPERYVQTADDGRFTFPKPEKPCVLLVMHDKGWHTAPFKDAGGTVDVFLEPWARVEGVIRIGAAPAAGRHVRLTCRILDENHSSHIMHDCKATADASGRFVIERVLPGHGEIGYEVALPGDRDRLTHVQRFTLRAGQTKNVQLGGTGRPVIGRIELPKDISASSLKWNNYMNVLRPRWIPQGDLLTLSDLSEMAVVIQEDGAFRVEDVPCGGYELSLTLCERVGGKRRLGMLERPLGTVSKEFVVPDTPGGRSAEPVDLGKIPFAAAAKLKVGDPAPPLSVVMPGRRSVRVQDYRGKHVLLYFYRFEVPPPTLRAMERVHRTHSAGGRLVLLGIDTLSGVQENSQRLQREAEKVDWAIGAVEDGKRSSYEEAYGLPWGAGLDIVSVFLIGPDGRILGSHLDAEGISDTVDKALRGATTLPEEKGPPRE